MNILFLNISRKKKLFDFLCRNFYSSATRVREIANNGLNRELTSAGDKLVIVQFFVTWFELFFYFDHSIDSFIFRCDSCKTIAPHVERLSGLYLNNIFLNVNI